jgi:carbon-monoxide dehydrogenase medium subunit
MKPPPFDYVVPGSVREAVSLLKQHDGEAKLIAGGQSLMPLLNMRLARPAALIDVNRLKDLDYVREADGGLAIGAITRQRTVEKSDLVKNRLPLLHAALQYVSHPQIRNRGTFGGSLAHADPSAECPAVALALDAEFRIAGPEGERKVKAGDFFLTYLTTVLEPTEMLTEVRLPLLPARTGWSVQEVSRRHGDFAMAGVVAVMTLDGSGKCSAARIVLFGVAPTPIRAHAAEQVLAGVKPGEAVFEQAGKKASGAVEEPLSDIHASGEFRRHLAEVLTRRALAEASSRA